MYSILHVDNSVFFKKILQQVTTESGATLVSVTSPSEAILTMQKKRFDLIITGIELKDMNGFDFIKFINKGSFKDIPKVVLTSNDSVEVRKKADALGVMDVIQKDISLNSLFSFIERVKVRIDVKAELRTMSIAILGTSKERIEEIEKILKNEDVYNIKCFEGVYSFIKDKNKYSLYFIDSGEVGRDAEKIIIDIRRENMNSIIIATANGYDPEYISNILLAGADDVVVKPISRKVFMARLNANVRLQMHLKEMEKKNEELQDINSELNRLVITDGLTGLYNHKYIMDRLELEVEKSKRYNRPLSVIMMDIDHFKKVNDTYGHQVGDIVLRLVSDTMRLNLRKVDVVGRYGGEEFFIILPETELEQSVLIADKIRTVIETQVYDSEALKITISGGVACWENQTVGSFIKTADEFLYEAKRTGRNKVVHEGNSLKGVLE